jgi:hypothetical protein
LFGIPIRNFDESLRSTGQLLPLSLELLAVASTLSANVDEYRVGIIQHFAPKVTSIQGDHIRREWVSSIASRKKLEKE